MFLATLLDNIKPSSTFAIAEKAAKMRADNIDVISLSTGESDYDTADNIKAKAINAIKTGKTKYTNVDGIPDLKKAIVTKFMQDNNLEYSIEQITVGAGAKQVLFNALMATINEGDEVIIPSPYWVSYPDMVAIMRGKPVIVECNSNNAFILQPQDLERVITPRTKWLILNSPNNPTGAVYKKKELKAIADVLVQHPHIHIISDDIYEHIIYRDEPFYTIAQISPAMYKRTLTVNGVSKAYAMTGWRIGYAAGDKTLIQAIAKVQSQSTSNPCSISQFAAVEALSGVQSFLQTQASTFKKRRDMVVQAFCNIPGLYCKAPDGAFYVFVSCSGVIGKSTENGRTITNSIDFANYLLEHSLVAVVPGSAFGMEGFFRVSYATSLSILEKALNRIDKACRKLH